MADLKNHPASELFPLMDGIELRSLADDIAANGLLEPISLLDGQVLDGRNRLRACKASGVEPRFVDVDLGGLSPTESKTSPAALFRKAEEIHFDQGTAKQESLRRAIKALAKI